MILVITQMFWPVIGESIYYYGDAVFKVVILYVWSKKMLGGWKVVFDIFYLQAISNLIDEIWFNPEAIEVNEYIGFGIVILISIIKYKRNESK